MKLITANGKQVLRMTKDEWLAIGLKFEEAKKKKKGKKKDWNPNPWAVCHTTVDKKKDPEKFERCVMDVKKKQK